MAEDQSIIDEMLAGQADLQPGQSVSEGFTTSTPRVSAEERAAQRERTNQAIDAMGQPIQDMRALNAQTSAAREGVTKRYNERTQAPLADLAELDKQEQATSREFAVADKEYQNALKEREKYRLATQNAINTMDETAKQIAADNANEMFTNPSVARKLTSSLLLGLGAAAQALYKDRTNAVADQFDADLKRELAIQRMNMEKRKDAYGNQNLLLGRMMQHYDRVEHAQDAAYIATYNGIRGRMDALKSMMTNPQMRMNLEKWQADMDMKAVEAQERLQSNTIGMDLRMRQGVAALEQKREAAMSADNELKRYNAETRRAAENRLAGKDQREQQKLEVPGWEPVPQANGEPGHVMADPQEMRKFREGEDTARRATLALSEVADSLERGGQFTSYPKWQDIKASVGRATATIKGPGMVNAGANFTQLEQTLIEAGYLGADGNWKRNIDPTASRRIRHAIDAIWLGVEQAGKERNLRPTKQHDFLEP
jgi:hypothetical protein